MDPPQKCPSAVVPLETDSNDAISGHCAASIGYGRGRRPRVARTGTWVLIYKRKTEIYPGAYY